MGDNKTEIWKQVIAVVGTIIVALITAWGIRTAGRSAQPAPTPAPAPKTTLAEEPKFVTQFQYRAQDITRTEYEMAADAPPATGSSDFAELRSIEYGQLRENEYG